MTKNIITDLSIIIVNYRGWKDLAPCLDSLSDLSGEKIRAEVIVVDNASNDGMLQVFSDNFPWVQFRSNTGNFGFSSACNLGVSQAQGNYLLFLNPDIIANNAAILGMLEILHNESEIMLLSCRQQNENGKEEYPYNFFPDWFTTNAPIRSFYKIFHKKEFKENYSPQKDLIFPDWVSGSVMMFSASNFSKTGGWDEDYWLYYEDVELCWQVKATGGRVALSNRFSMQHRHGGTTRINPQTTAITKAEVRISKHVYLSHHFRGFKAFVLHTFCFLGSIFGKLVPALLGIPFFFVSKLRSYTFLYFRLLRYYIEVLKNGTWISPRAPNFLKK